MSVPTLEIQVADLYVKAKTRLDQVPRLLDAGLKAAYRQETYRISSELTPQEWKDRSAPPEFSANDLSGRTWPRRDLEGKGTLVNYWATWCGPCRAEHPDLQKLHEPLDNRKDVQVLTISVDDTPALAAAYVKEKGYTSPVIHAPALADKLLPWAGLPANFLVNGKGERTTFYPFLSGEARLRQALADLEHAAQQRE